MRLALIAMPGATLLSAQETVNNASLSLRVTDPSGATVENAAVSVRQLDTNHAAQGLPTAKAVSGSPTCASDGTR